MAVHKPRSKALDGATCRPRPWPPSPELQEAELCCSSRHTCVVTAEPTTVAWVALWQGPLGPPFSPLQHTPLAHGVRQTAPVSFPPDQNSPTCTSTAAAGLGFWPSVPALSLIGASLLKMPKPSLDRRGSL